jgi:hypothetical protein
MPQYATDLVRNLFIFLFFSFRHREIKVEREYMAIVFNGFINA